MNFHKKSITTLFGLLYLTFFACDNKSFPTSFEHTISKYSNLSGVVISSYSNTPLSNISIDIVGFGSIRTNDDGVFNFYEIPNGTYAITAADNNNYWSYYFPVYRTITLNDNSASNDVVIELPNGLIKSVISSTSLVLEPQNIIGDNDNEARIGLGDSTYIIVDLGSSIQWPQSDVRLRAYGREEDYNELNKIYTSSSPNGPWIYIDILNISDNSDLISPNVAISQYLKITGGSGNSGHLFISRIWIGPKWY